MADFFEGGVFIGSNPTPVGGKDLGEIGGPGSIIPDGFAPSTPVPIFPTNTLISSYWAKFLGVVFPYTIGDSVAIGRVDAAYNAKLSVGGDIFATGFILSDTVRVTKDEDDNLVFTDPVSGSKTLAQIIAAAGGDVLVSGVPTNTQLAEWIDSTHIRGIAKSTLALAQSQITGLMTALGGKASTVHSLVNTTNHPVTGLTAGHFLKALTPTSYGFAAHGLNAIAVGLGSVTNNAQVKKIASSTDLAIMRWSGTTGDLPKNSLTLIDDLGNVNIPAGATYKINGVPILLHDIALLWAKVSFTASALPIIANYQDDQVDPEDPEKILNYAEDYGENPHIRCIIIVDSTHRYQLQQMPQFTYVDGLIDTIYFELAEELTGYILISKA